MAQQPSGMTNENGAILSVGLFCNGEAFQYVMPISTDSTDLNLGNLCQDAVLSFEASINSDIQPCMSSDGYIAFIAATGMQPGRIPFRKGYLPTDFPGTSTANASPTNVAALGVIYQDPADEGVGAGRIRMAKIFMAGLARADTVGNQISSELGVNITNLINDLQAGWSSQAEPEHNWYRVLDVPKPTSVTTPVKRLLAPELRRGIYTQKRRLTPRSV